MTSAMCINLDSFEVLNLTLGNKTDLPDGNHQSGSINFHTQNSLIKNINVRLSEFYSQGETYEGSLIVNGELVTVNEQLQPADILRHFSAPSQHWDDGVEVNYQFQIMNVNIEFSWHYRAETLVPNYISLEID